MADIIKTYTQAVPAARFIGKQYGDADRVDGMFGAKWGEWFQSGWFDQLEKLGDIGEGSIGLMRDHNGAFEYYIGYFMPADVIAPEGFVQIDFPAGTLGVAWVYGKEDEVFMHEGESWEKLVADKTIPADADAQWCFERYNCPRFTTPDDKGNIILDVCFYL